MNLIFQNVRLQPPHIIVNIKQVRILLPDADFPGAGIPRRDGAAAEKMPLYCESDADSDYSDPDGADALDETENTVTFSGT